MTAQPIRPPSLHVIRRILRAGLLLAGLTLWAGLALLTGCRTSSPDDSPVGVVKRLTAAVKTRDTEAIYELLGPSTRARLQAAAERATSLRGGRPALAPHEMLSPAFRSQASADWAPEAYELLEKSDELARVAVRGKKKDERRVVTLVKTEDGWRVEFDQPPLPGSRPTQK